LSRYIRPSFHPKGQVVACGTMKGAIHLWDIRYQKFYLEPTKTLDVHGMIFIIIFPNHSLLSKIFFNIANRIFRAEWHPFETDNLLSISSDNSLIFQTLEL